MLFNTPNSTLKFYMMSYSLTQINTCVLKLLLSLLTKTQVILRPDRYVMAPRLTEVKRHRRLDLTGPSRDTRLPTRVTAVGKAEVSRPASSPYSL